LSSVWELGSNLSSVWAWRLPIRINPASPPIDQNFKRGGEYACVEYKKVMMRKAVAMYCSEI
jgi:hypothetical protein